MREESSFKNTFLKWCLVFPCDWLTHQRPPLLVRTTSDWFWERSFVRGSTVIILMNILPSCCWRVVHGSMCILLCCAWEVGILKARANVEGKKKAGGEESKCLEKSYTISLNNYKTCTDERPFSLLSSAFVPPPPPHTHTHTHTRLAQPPLCRFTWSECTVCLYPVKLLAVAIGLWFLIFSRSLYHFYYLPLFLWVFVFFSQLSWVLFQSTSFSFLSSFCRL